MSVNAYLELQKETEESMGYIVRGIASVVSESGMPGLRYENDPEINREDLTWRTTISVYNFTDAQSVLEFSDMVGDKLGMPILLRIKTD